MFIKKGENVKQLKDIQPGESVVIAGKTWTVLDDVGTGIMCIMNKIISRLPFDESKERTNNYGKSSLRRELNTSFLKEIEKNLGQEPIDTEIDLITDDGLTDYGTCKDKVFILSTQQYRKYRKIIKKQERSWWTITADSTHTYEVRYVKRDGSLGDYYIKYYGECGVLPVCVFPSSIYIDPDEREIEIMMHVNAKIKYKGKDEVKDLIVERISNTGEFEVISKDIQIYDEQGE